MDIWFDVDAGLAEVPVNIFPLIDDTDFKSKEEAIAYNEAGMDLVWNFVTTAGAMTQTAVTPTTGGAYDWAHQGNGMYYIEIPASGGASINNDTEGFGWFTGVCTGVLPWRSPMFGFRAAGLNNILIDSAYSATRGLAGTALPDAAADAAGGLPISDAGGLDLDTQIKTDIDAILADTNELQVDDTPTALTTLSGKVDSILEDTGTTIPGTITTIDNEIAVIDGIVDSILADTGTDGVVLANDAITAAKIAANAIGASELAADAVTEIQSGLALEATLTAIKGAGWTTETLVAIDALIDNLDGDVADVFDDVGDVKAVVDSILADTNELQTDDIPGTLTTIEGKVDTIDGIVDSILADTGTDGVVIADDAITADKFDESTAYPLKAEDAGSTEIARTGADSDTLETLSDQLDGIYTIGTGAIEWTYTLTDSVSGVPIADANIWITSDSNGNSIIASGTTNTSGIATFHLDAGTVYVWCQKDGYNFTNPDTETVA